jgi:hypothetical protein
MFELKKQTNLNEPIKVLDLEAEQNLVGFFELILKVDKRINPQLYKELADKEIKND